MPTHLPVVSDQCEMDYATQVDWPQSLSGIAETIEERSSEDVRPFSESTTTRPALIPDELAWRRLPRQILADPDAAFASMRFSRWREMTEHGGTHQCATEASMYTLGIALQPTDAVIAVDGRRINESAMRVGSILASGPGQQWRAQFHRRSDFLHVHFAPECLADCLKRSTGRSVDIHELFAFPVLLIDNVALELARSLVATSESNTGFAEVGAHALGIAIAARVLELLHDVPRLSRVLSRGQRQSISGATLAPWRMRKVLAFIDESLGQPLSLQRIADASGLSKMHFAALFRASTGMSPSGFVVQRRIERAQAELLCTSKPVVDVALSLGFQTQAHFSTVFKRVIGEAPSEWRRRHTNPESEHAAGWRLGEDQSPVDAPSSSTSFSSSS